MFYNEISQIEIELTTRCNAACPQCVRNYYGGPTWPSLPLVDIGLDTLINAITPLVARLDHIRLCGTYGDPCLHVNLPDFVTWLVDNTRVEITINTNGGMRNPQWWINLAERLRSRGRVFFGIDGLQDTNHLYRRNVSWKRLISNLQAFNDAGGNSVWSFIAFEHNQHQIQQARQLSVDLGCAGFGVKRTGRFVNKLHQPVAQTPVMDHRYRTISWLKPPTQANLRNQAYDQACGLETTGISYSNYLQSNTISCVAKHTGLINISAQGYVLPCGFLMDRLYGYEAEQHPDHQLLLDMIRRAGGFDTINIHSRSIQDIVCDDFFSSIAASWTTSARLERCAHMCNDGINVVQGAYTDMKDLLAGKFSQSV